MRKGQTTAKAWGAKLRV